MKSRFRRYPGIVQDWFLWEHELNPQPERASKGVMHMLKSVKNFPAPAIGVLASILLYVQQAIEGTASWEEAIPAAVGVAIAFFVTPSSRVSSNNYVIQPSEKGYATEHSLIGLVVVVVLLLVVLRLFGVI